MKSGVLLVGLAVAPFWFCGCEQFTDSIANQTAHPVRVKVTFAGGVVNDHLDLSGTNETISGILFRKPVTVESLEAFDSNGKKIGEFSRNAIPCPSREYGKCLFYAVFDDGVFPVAKSCVRTGSAFVSEEQVKRVFKKEKGQE